MPRPSHREYGRAAILATLALAACLPACTAGPSNRPAVAVRESAISQSNKPAPSSVPPPPLEPPLSPTLEWKDCTPETRSRLGVETSMPFQCESVRSTLDSPTRPGRGPMTISVLRVGSGEIPLAVVNDASGEPGTLYAARLATELPKELLETFSLIGVDRRGTGGSDPVDCVSEPVRARIIGFDPAATHQDQLEKLLDAAGEAAQGCVLDDDGDRVPAYDTWRAAADLNKVREKLGMAKLHAIGRGEGSRVLTVFADRFPDAVGRFVLDGSPDPTLDGIGQAQARAGSAEKTLDGFAAECTAQLNCPLGANPRQSLVGLLDQLRKQPLTRSDGTQITAGTALNGVLVALADRRRWPELAELLVRVRDGDGSGLAQLLRPVLVSTETDPARFDGAFATACNNTTTRVPPERIAATAAEWASKYPLFGAYFAQQLLLCSPWPVPSKPLPTPQAVNAPPIIVLATVNDPVTPGQGTSRTANQLPSGVLVTWQNSGHGALPHSQCATAATTLFLTKGQVPTDGMVCPP